MNDLIGKISIDEPAPVAENPATVKTPKRAVFDMFESKMQVEFKDPEFQKKWFVCLPVDRDNRIASLLRRGYTFVEKEEVLDEYASIAPRNIGVGTRVEFYAERNERGEIARHYLMKQRMEDHLEDEAARERYHQTVELAIRSGQNDRAPNDGRFTAQTMPGTRLPNITMNVVNQRNQR